MIIFSFALVDIITIYNVGGINWDFVAEVLYAKAILTPSFYHALFSGNLANAINYGNSFYFETIRPPLIGILMASFAVLGGNNFVPFYLTFGLLLLLFSAIYLSKIIDVDPLLLTLLFFTPYVIFFFFMLTGTEIIAMSFLLIFIGLVLKKRWESGIMIAIAGLAKYNALVFLLLLFILPKEARKQAFISFVLVMLPWFIFNTIVWGNPIYSYIISSGSFAGGSQGFFNVYVIIRSLQLILPDLLPAFVISVSLLLIVYFWRYKIDKNWRNAKLFSISNLSYKYRVVFSVLGIGWIFWLLGAVAGSLNDSPREGYIIYIGLALLFGILITDLSKKIKLPNKRTVYVYVVVLLFVITLGMLISAFNSIYTNYIFGVYGSTNPIYNTLKILWRLMDLVIVV